MAKLVACPVVINSTFASPSDFNHCGDRVWTAAVPSMSVSHWLSFIVPLGYRIAMGPTFCVPSHSDAYNSLAFLGAQRIDCGMHRRKAMSNAP